MADNTTNERTGGKWALSGFFYQAVGIAGLVARTYNLIEQGLDGDDLDAIVEVVGLVPEAHYDQDAVLFPVNGMGPKQCAFYQFKFSGSQNTLLLKANNFKDIVCAFVKGTRLADADGYTVFRYVLATNKIISRKVTNWIAEKRLDATGLKDVVDSLLGEQAASCPADQRAHIENEVKHVLLHFHPPIIPANLPSFWKELHSYGERLGLNRELILNGIRLLMADQFIEGAEGRGVPITREVLNKAFTGCENPCELTISKIKEKYPPDVSPLLRDRLEDIADRKAISERLETLIAAGKQLIVLIGRGGAGKSSFLAKWVAHSLTKYPDAMIEVKHASCLPDNWIAKTVSGWSGILLLVNCSNADALRRLKIANGSTPHKLYLILDGIDETSGDLTNRIRQLLDEVYGAPPNVVLIVTCREPNWFEDLLEPMGGMVKGELHDMSVSVDYFDNNEFSELVMSMEQSVVKEKLLELVIANTSTTFVPNTDYNALGNDEIPFAEAFTSVSGCSDWESELFQALRHPVLWSVFGQMQSLDQESLLGNSPAGYSHFGNGIVKWFTRKINLRQPAHYFDEVDVKLLLRTISQSTLNHAVYDREVWTQNSQAYGWERSVVFREGISSGLIELQGARRWRWVNQLVCKSLSATESETEVETL
ncbi:NACHT domain-containing protein [Trichlorobacter lovleyi]|uniref:NACHT domain-containing protein n=1 Tax=Trichlorobacter lovleyi TaxID=313985 RepID=UPI003D0F65E2